MRKSLLILGGTDNSDFQDLRARAQSGSPTVERWSTLKGASTGDEIWFYFPSPISAVVASGVAAADAAPDVAWPYVMPVRDLRWLRAPVTLQELRAQFPDWGWTRTARGRTYLPEEIAHFLRERREGDAPSEVSINPTPLKSGERRERDTLPAAGYRLNWNADANANDVTHTDVEDCERFGYVDKLWRCGDARVQPGQRLFLMRTGSGPRGLIGIGRATSVPTSGEDEEEDPDAAPARGVSIRLTVLSLTPLVEHELLSRPPLDAVAWSAQTAAARMTREQVDALEALAGPFNDQPPLLADEPDYVEGAPRQVVVNGFERNQAARLACLRHWGTRCSVCSLDFGARYGAAFAGLIHVHHLAPLSGAGAEHRVDPVADLRPICPNCHAMIHSRRPTPLSIEELKSIIGEKIPCA